jgi:hypothetical protein
MGWPGMKRGNSTHTLCGTQPAAVDRPRYTELAFASTSFQSTRPSRLDDRPVEVGETTMWNDQRVARLAAAARVYDRAMVVKLPQGNRRFVPPIGGQVPWLSIRWGRPWLCIDSDWDGAPARSPPSRPIRAARRWPSSTGRTPSRFPPTESCRAAPPTGARSRTTPSAVRGQRLVVPGEGKRPWPRKEN